MLGISLAPAQKCAHLDTGQLTARWSIGFVPDKHVSGSGVATKEPPIPVRAIVKLSLFQRHGGSWALPGLNGTR